MFISGPGENQPFFAVRQGGQGDRRVRKQRQQFIIGQAARLGCWWHGNNGPIVAVLPERERPLKGNGGHAQQSDDRESLQRRATSASASENSSAGQQGGFAVGIASVVQ